MAELFFPCLLCCCCCSVAKLCLTLGNPKDCSTSGFPVLHHLLEFAQTLVHWVGDAIQSSHSLPPTYPSALNQRASESFPMSQLFTSGGQSTNTVSFESESHSVMSNSLRPMISPGQNTGVGSLSLLQRIFPTQGSNRGLPRCRQILYQLSHRGSLRRLERVA